MVSIKRIWSIQSSAKYISKSKQSKIGEDSKTLISLSLQDFSNSAIHYLLRGNWTIDFVSTQI